MSKSDQRSRGASGIVVTPGQRLGHWFKQHQIESREALRRLLLTPVSTLVTLFLLAVVLAVPTFMYSLLGNLKQLAPGAEFEPQLALYLDPALDVQSVDRFSRTLLIRDDLISVELISSETGAKEFKAFSDMGELISLLKDNPLPAVIFAIPRDQSPDSMKLLQAELAQLPEVEVAELDIEWLERLGTIINSFASISLVLALLLALTVLLVVTNTIRTLISARQEEIEVSLLIGATHAWVRRPFLYTGLLYGFFGALLGLCLVYFSLALVESPLSDLTALYVGRFDLKGPDLGLLGLLIGGGSALGWIGAYIAVSRQMVQLHSDT